MTEQDPTPHLADDEEREAARVGRWLDRDAFHARSDHEDFMAECQAPHADHAVVVGRTVSVLTVLDAAQLFAGDDAWTDQMVGRAVQEFERTLRAKIGEHRP